MCIRDRRERYRELALNALHGLVDLQMAEGVSNTILEAMACGLPVIATDVGGNAELVQHGQAGLVIPPDDVPAMAQALCRLATQPLEAQRMGTAGRAAIEQRFSCLLYTSRCV